MRVRQRGQNMEREPPCRQDPNPDSDSRSPRAIHQNANQSGTNNAKNQFLPQNTPLPRWTGTSFLLAYSESRSQSAQSANGRDTSRYYESASRRDFSEKRRAKSEKRLADG